MSTGNLRKARWQVLKRDNFTCQYCGRKAPDVILEVDHVIPHRMGGTDTTDNLVTACYDCNQGKQGEPLEVEPMHITQRRLDLQAEMAINPLLVLVPEGTLTRDEVIAAMTPYGGWTKDQLTSWGVPWPPPRGWRQRIERPIV